MNMTVSGVGLNSLVRLYQQMGYGFLGADGSSNTTGNQVVTNLFSQLQGGSATNPFSMLMGGGNAGTDLMSALAGLNPGNAALMSLMLSQGTMTGVPSGASNVTQPPATPLPPPQPNAAAGALKNLLDTMFANASGVAGKMDQTQFENFVKQMDPNGTSGVNADKLFGQLDPNKTGFVTQAQFDAALNGTGGATKADADAISAQFSKLTDAMFKNADTYGIGQLNITQFTDLVNQMDPTGKSGVKAGNLFAQMDPYQTGYVSQTQFNAAIQGIKGSLTPAAAPTQTTGTANAAATNNTASALFSQYSVQMSIMQYRSTMDLLNNALVGGSANTGGINSLLNVII